ncbi:MAG: hypothetical protein WHT07_11715 [Desulfobaccales bacterium]
MRSTLRPRPLKVCGTCRHWTKEYKGFCRRLMHGVGKFHLCADWENGTDQPEAEALPAAVDSSCQSSSPGEAR